MATVVNIETRFCGFGQQLVGWGPFKLWQTITDVYYAPTISELLQKLKPHIGDRTKNVKVTLGMQPYYNPDYEYNGYDSVTELPWPLALEVFNNLPEQRDDTHHPILEVHAHQVRIWWRTFYVPKFVTVTIQPKHLMSYKTPILPGEKTIVYRLEYSDL